MTISYMSVNQEIFHSFTTIHYRKTIKNNKNMGCMMLYVNNMCMHNTCWDLKKKKKFWQAPEAIQFLINALRKNVWKVQIWSAVLAKNDSNFLKEELSTLFIFPFWMEWPLDLAWKNPPHLVCLSIYKRSMKQLKDCGKQHIYMCAC